MRKNAKDNNISEGYVNTDNAESLNTSSQDAAPSNEASKVTAKPKKIKKKYNIIPKIVCVLVAIVIWLYVMQVDSPDYEHTFEDIPIDLSNTSVLENERGLFVYSGYGYTFDITVNGKKSIISKYTVDDIKASVDLKDIRNAGEHDAEINVKLPSGLTLVSKEFDEITVYADEKSSIDVPIKAKLTGANYNNEYEYGELVTEYNSVIVTGPKSSIASIENALASVDLSGLGVIKETTSAVRPLVLVNKNGDTVSNPYIKLSRGEVKVTLPVYTEKVVTLTVDTVNGYFNDRNTKITVTPSEIRIKGDPVVLSGIKNINVATLDEKEVEEGVKYTYELENSDKYTYLSNSTISVVVDHINTVTKTYSVENIEVVAGANDYRLSDKSLDITLRGSEAQLEMITAEDIELVADISGYSTDYSGTVSIEVDVNITKTGISGVYELGTYRVLIGVNEN